VSNYRALITLCLAGFAAIIGFGVLFPVLPLYAEGMGASPAQVGLTVAAYSYVTAVALIPFGMLSDRVGHRRIVVAGLLISSLAPLLYPLADSLTQLNVVRAFHGLASAMLLPAAVALVLSSVSAERCGEALGWFGLSTQSALVVGPALGGLLLSHYGFTASFYACAVLSSLGLILVLFRWKTIQAVTSVEAPIPSSFGWLKQPKVFAGLVAPFFFTMGSGTILTFMPLYSEALGITAAQAGIIVAALYAGSALLRLPGGKLSDRIGRGPVILAGLAISGIAMISISFVGFLPGLIAMAVCYGVGMGLAMSAAYALVADLTSPSLRGLTMGLTTSFLHGGLAFGPTIMGVVAGMSDYPTMFRISTLSLVLGWVVVFSLTRKQR
jgi:DHA1 family multidrug resistance protein-like MFS transporter